jgi:hypothetical protein
MRLLHGTTLARAERIVRGGPDVGFVEPGDASAVGNFSFTAEGTPSAVGTSVTYALGKAAAFPDERGPALVAVEVPDDVVRQAALEHLALFNGLIRYNVTAELRELVALCGGIVQFDPGPTLDSLLKAWGTIPKEIRGVP